MSLTLEEARNHLNLWLEADRAVATGQSYKIGSKMLTRASVRDIAERISYWRAEVARLEGGRRPGARVFNVVPRDY